MARFPCVTAVALAAGGYHLCRMPLHLTIPMLPPPHLRKDMTPTSSHESRVARIRSVASSYNCTGMDPLPDIHDREVVHAFALFVAREPDSAAVMERACPTVRDPHLRIASARTPHCRAACLRIDLSCMRCCRRFLWTAIRSIAHRHSTNQGCRCRSRRFRHNDGPRP